MGCGRGAGRIQATRQRRCDGQRAFPALQEWRAGAAVDCHGLCPRIERPGQNGCIQETKYSKPHSSPRPMRRWDCESKCQPGISRRKCSRCRTTAHARWNSTVENHKRYLRRERVRNGPGRRAPRGTRVVRLPRSDLLSRRRKCFVEFAEILGSECQFQRRVVFHDMTTRGQYLADQKDLLAAPPNCLADEFFGSATAVLACPDVRQRPASACGSGPSLMVVTRLCRAFADRIGHS